MLFALTLSASLALALAPIASGSSTPHHLRDLSLSHHHHFASHKSRRVLPRQGRRVDRRQNDATVQCLSRYTFALCAGSDCTPMGAVAQGTACVDGGIVMDTAGSSSSSQAVAQVADPVTSSSSSVTSSASSSSSNSPHVVLAVATATTEASTASSESTTASPTSTDAGDDGDCDASDVAEGSDSSADSTSSSDLATSTFASPPTSTSSQETSPTSTSTQDSIAAAATVLLAATTSYTPTTTSTTASPAAVTGALSSILSGSANGPFTDGFATYYNQDGGYGACGQQHSDSDFIVALALARYGTGSNNAPDCGRSVIIQNQANGKTVTAVVADACPGCRNYDSLDLSIATFDAIGDAATGVLDITWGFTS